MAAFVVCAMATFTRGQRRKATSIAMCTIDIYRVGFFFFIKQLSLQIIQILTRMKNLSFLNVLELTMAVVRHITSLGKFL